MNQERDPLDPNWLDRYIRYAVRENLCTKIGCTTCGAREFRLGWRAALNRARRSAAGDPEGGGRLLSSGFARIRPRADETLERIDEEGARFLSAGLARIRPEPLEPIDEEGSAELTRYFPGGGTIEEAIRNVLYDMEVAGALCGRECRDILSGTWAGSILVRAEEHYRADVERAERHERTQKELQAAAAERKRQRNRQKQERLRARLAAKIERDRSVVHEVCDLAAQEGPAAPDIGEGKDSTTLEPGTTKRR